MLQRQDQQNPGHFNQKPLSNNFIIPLDIFFTFFSPKFPQSLPTWRHLWNVSGLKLKPDTSRCLIDQKNLKNRLSGRAYFTLF